MTQRKVIFSLYKVPPEPVKRQAAVYGVSHVMKKVVLLCNIYSTVGRAAPATFFKETKSTLSRIEFRILVQTSQQSQF